MLHISPFLHISDSFLSNFTLKLTVLHCKTTFSGQKPQIFKIGHSIYVSAPPTVPAAVPAFFCPHWILCAADRPYADLLQGRTHIFQRAAFLNSAALAAWADRAYNWRTDTKTKGVSKMSGEKKGIIAAITAYIIFGLSYLFSKMALAIRECCMFALTKLFPAPTGARRDSQGIYPLRGERFETLWVSKSAKGRPRTVESKIRAPRRSKGAAPLWRSPASFTSSPEPRGRSVRGPDGSLGARRG